MSDDLERATTRTCVEHEKDGGLLRYTFFEPVRPTLPRLLDELFQEHWACIVVGPCIEGSVFEVCFTARPKVTILDGYMTVDLGPWHFHLCVGPHRGTRSTELRQNRPAAKAAFFERRGPGCGGGRSWGLRAWNGFGEQMTTIWLPNAYQSDDMKVLEKPDWGRLKLYYELRHRFLGEPLPSSFEKEASKSWRLDAAGNEGDGAPLP